MLAPTGKKNPHSQRRISVCRCSAPTVILTKMTSWKARNKAEAAAAAERELIVFGYGAKLFRDDATAAAVEEGRTLVAWRGDASLLVDRCVESQPASM